MLTFLVGGARSGKSRLAVELGRRHCGPVVVLATAEPFDADLAARIAAHRAERPPWPTHEVPLDLAATMATIDDDTLIIVDCLTVWMGNLFHHHHDDDQRHLAVDAFVEVLAARGERQAPSVVVSNEVGMGLIPDTDLGRRYRDELGRLNQRVAATADHTLLLVAGRAMALADPLALLTEASPAPVEMAPIPDASES